MDAIEKRARELLAAHLPKGCWFWRAPLLDPQYPADYFPDTYKAAIKAIACALTPPEGWVLVPECHTPAMDDAGCLALFGSTGGKQSAQVWKCWDAMIAARPEVKP